MLADCYECGKEISTEAHSCPYCGYIYGYTTYDKVGDGHYRRRDTDDYGQYETKPKSDNGCFIATAAYGTPLANEVGLLRQFRDDHLVLCRTGRMFIATYYRLSPPIAEVIKQSRVLRAITRATLRPIIWLLRK